MSPSQPYTLPDAELSGYQHAYARVKGQRLHYLTGGDPEGDVVVLLAGFPQSGYAWRRVIPLLSSRFRVIVPDLPGQGDSDLPVAGYDTETVAQQIQALLVQLDISDYAVAAHDVGAWVAFPLAALFPTAVKKLVLLDAGIPGVTLPDALPATADAAWKTWHFAFHQLPDLPEALISGREEIYLDWFLKRKAANPMIFSQEDMQEYTRIFKRNGAIRAGLAFYREAEKSAVQNRAMLEKGKINVPLLAVSADQGSIPDMAAPLRPYFTHVDGITLSHCGHFIPEEQPEALAQILNDFF